MAFHDRFFVPNNAILAIVGDVTAEEAFDEATRVFGGWHAARRADGRTDAPSSPRPRAM